MFHFGIEYGYTHNINIYILYHKEPNKVNICTSCNVLSTLWPINLFLKYAFFYHLLFSISGIIITQRVQGELRKWYYPTGKVDWAIPWFQTKKTYDWTIPNHIKRVTGSNKHLGYTGEGNVLIFNNIFLHHWNLVYVSFLVLEWS